jgi:hypothetical protein
MVAGYVTLSDVEAAYEGSFPTDPDAQLWLQSLIDRAERMLVAQVKSIPTRLAAGTLAVENVQDAIITAVLRVVRNPEGLQSETEGNYLYSVSRDVAGGKLYFTADDLLLVRSVRKGSAGTIVLAHRWDRVQ